MAKYRVTRGAKILIGIAAIGAFTAIGTLALPYLAPTMASSVPTIADLGDFSGAKDEDNTLVDVTGGKGSGVVVRAEILPWNSQMGLMFGNGGKNTAAESLMAKAGVRLQLTMTDMYGKMQADLVSCAQAMATSGKTECSDGTNLVAIMGDAGPSFIDALNDPKTGALSKLGPDYLAEIIPGVGRSYGEDKFMGPPRCAADSEACRGVLISGVLKDGDWNIALFWAGQNNICNNPDPMTWDPNCLNWVGTDSFNDADDKYVQGACEDRAVVKDGKRTGETKNVCVEAVVTWSPGDEAVVSAKGGLVSLLSTYENASQMPQVFVGIKKWDTAHRADITGILKASYVGAHKIRTGGDAILLKAADISAKVYGDKDAAYWAKLYTGYTVTDSQGNKVKLGGSQAFTLADALRYYGLADGTTNAYAATYTVFGQIMQQQYPKDLEDYSPVGDVLNLTYLQDLMNDSTVVRGSADETVFVQNPDAQVIADRDWSITFRTGSADFEGSAPATLDELLKALTVADNTIVEVHGHTDNVGPAEVNQALSGARAKAVRDWLISHGVVADRIGEPVAHGGADPIATNATPAGRAKNRRVQIVLKQN